MVGFLALAIVVLLVIVAGSAAANAVNSVGVINKAARNSRKNAKKEARSILFKGMPIDYDCQQ